VDEEGAVECRVVDTDVGEVFVVCVSLDELVGVCFDAAGRWCGLTLCVGCAGGSEDTGSGGAAVEFVDGADDVGAECGW